MQGLVVTTYRTLLKAAAKVDADFARRALVTASPSQVYHFQNHTWVEIDISREWPESQRQVDEMVRGLNDRKEWFHPPRCGEDGAIVRDGAVAKLVRGSFRDMPFTTQNLNLAFAGVKTLNAIEAGCSELPPQPLHEPTNYGYAVCHDGLATTAKAERTDGSSIVLLVAHPMMSGFFRHSIIVIGEFGDQGAIGVVVNKPLLNEHGQSVPVWSVVPDNFHPLFTKHLQNNPVMIGGPVRGLGHGGDDYGIFVVHRLPDIPDSVPIGQGVYFSGKMDAIHEAFEAGKASPKDVVVVMGYSGWGEQQLEGEVSRGSWFVAEGKESSLLFQGNEVAARQDTETMLDEGEIHGSTPMAKLTQEGWVRFFAGLNAPCAEMARLANVSEVVDH